MNAEELSKLFYQSRHLAFEDGMHSPLSKALLAALEGKPSETLRGLQTLFSITLFDPQHSVVYPIPSIVWGEVLRWIGLWDTEDYKAERLLILSICLLYSPSVYVRDGALVGLSYLDTVDCTVILEVARAQETETWLKADIAAVIAEYSSTIELEG